MTKRQRHILLLTPALLCFCLFIFSAVFFLIPYIRAILPLFNSKESLTLNSRNIIHTVFYTFRQSLLSTLLSLIIGLPAAYYISHKKFIFRKILIALSCLPLCMSTLIICLGYISTFGINGYYNQALKYIFNIKESPIRFLYSTYGIIMVQGFYNFPLIMMTTGKFYQNLDKTQEQSAMLLGASKARTFFTITIYRLIPVIISSCIPVFIFCFFSFMIVLLFGGLGGTTLEVSIYHASRSTLNFKNAALLSLIETTCTFFIFIIYALSERKSTSLKGSAIKNINEELKFLNKKDLILFVPFIFLILIFFIIPLFSIIISSFTSRKHGSYNFTLQNWKYIFSSLSFYKSLVTTMYTSLLTALLSTIYSLTCCIIIKLKDPQNKNIFFKTIILLPMAVSSVILGYGLLITYTGKNFILLVLAQSSLYWPFAFRQIYPFMNLIKTETINSGFLLSSKTDTIYNVMIPGCYKGIISAFLFTFAMSSGDSTLPLVLSIPEYTNLSLYIYRLTIAHRYNQSCAAGIVLGIICISLFIIGNNIRNKKNELS